MILYPWAKNEARPFCLARAKTKPKPKQASMAWWPCLAFDVKIWGWQVQSAFGREFPSSSLLPNWTICMDIATAISPHPPSSAGGPAPPSQGTQVSVAEDVVKKQGQTEDRPAAGGRRGSRLPESWAGRGAALGKGRDNGQGSKQGSSASSHFAGSEEDTEVPSQLALRSQVLSWSLSQLDREWSVSQLSREGQGTFSADKCVSM